MTLSADEGIASLQQRYREHIAPIVSRWLREVNLALTCLRLDETFPVFADGQLRPETLVALLWPLQNDSHIQFLKASSSS